MSNIIWMDGGILFELNKLSNDLGEKILIEQPDIIYELYKTYIESGAKMITTNNYGFKPIRIKNWRELCIRGATIFTPIKLDYPEITILGSVPPFHSTYYNGPISQDFLQFYNDLIPILNLYVDAFILETQIDIAHIRHICDIIISKRETAEIYISLYPDKIKQEDLWRLIHNYPNIKGILINCCSFDKMNAYYHSDIFGVLAAHNHLQFGFYLNKIDEESYKDRQNIDTLQNYKHNISDIDKIKEFYEVYNRKDLMIGGCCGYGVEEMKELINSFTQ